MERFVEAVLEKFVELAAAWGLLTEPWSWPS